MRTLRAESHLYRVFRRQEVPAGSTPMTFVDAVAAARFLRRLAALPPNLATLRAWCGELSPGAAADDEAVLGFVARALASRQWCLVRHSLTTLGLPLLTEPAGVEAAPAAPTAPPREDWIELVFVRDADGLPLPDVEVFLETPTGAIGRHTTDDRGRIELKGIGVGFCRAWCDEKDSRLARTWHHAGMGGFRAGPDEIAAAPHRPAEAMTGEGRRIMARTRAVRVRSGDTLASIAERHGLSWQELARFNWDTDAPGKIDEHLRDDVGCTRRTADGRNFIFSDDDIPGLLHVPERWEATGLATGYVHVVRGRRPVGVLLLLENEEGLRIPEAAFRVTFADGSVRQGRLGRNGMALLADPPPGDYRVVYVDEDDVLAKSLAVSVRSAFDAHLTHQIFRMFAYDPGTVRRARAAYDRYCNDYTGQGLVADIYQALTDPAALDLCEPLMAYHGLPTEREVHLVPDDRNSDEWGLDG